MEFKGLQKNFLSKNFERKEGGGLDGFVLGTFLLAELAGSRRGFFKEFGKKRGGLDGIVLGTFLLAELGGS